MEAETAASPDEIGGDGEAIAKRWHLEIKLAKKARAKWWKRSKKIIARYRNETPGDREEKEGAARFNVLWSNVQTLLPAVYAKKPEPWVERRYRDSDPIGRAASTILERCVRVIIEKDYHAAMRQAALDYLLPGQGVVWLRYDPAYDGEEGAVASERVCTDHVDYEDFLANPARTCAELRWVARRSFLTRADMEKRFGEIAKSVPLDYKPKDLPDDDKGGAQDRMFKRATVWEIWNKDDKKVYFVSEHFGQPLEVADDPLKLDNFWPMPDPLLATTANDSIVPVPDYAQYFDQADELDRITGRIYALTKALKAAGVYDSSVPALQRLLEEGHDNTLIPVPNWSEFTQKGGMAKAIDLLPIKDIAEVLIRLYESRQQIKNDLYEITGIADIVRGQSQGPAKTATEQRIKGQFASLRLQDRQQAVQRFCRDAIAIIAEIVAEHFSPETLFLMSGYGETEEFRSNPDQGRATFQKAAELLKHEKLRGFRVEIETDSTVEADAQAEKQARIEFIGAVAQFMPQAIEGATQHPMLAPLFGKMLLFGVRAFKVGRDLESAMENAIVEMERAKDAPPKPSPEEMQAQAKAEIDKKLADNQADIDQQNAANERDIAQKNAQNERNIKLIGAHNDMKIAAMKGAQDVAHKERAASQERETKKAMAGDERIQKQLSHASEIQAKNDGARQDREIARKKVEPGPEIEAAQSVLAKIPALVGQIVDESMDRAGDAMAKRINALKLPARVKRPTYDKDGNIVEVREEDA